MKGILSFCIMFSMLVSCQVSFFQKQETLIKTFILDVADDHISTDEIIENYLCKLDSNKENYKMVSSAIIFLRDELNNKYLKTLMVLNYDELPKANQKILLDKGDYKKVFAIQIKNSKLIYILLEEERIVSFVTLNKGTNKLFLKFCQ